MSHPLVAAVWEQLGRPDIANILREIIGEHAAQMAVSQVQNGLVADIESLVRMIFWIRAVFDLQRSYLQGLTSLRDCHPSLFPYLLPSETVYSTLMYLLRVKSELLPMTAAAAQDRGQYRYYMAETLLAGVRLLLLRGDGLHADMKLNLERATKTAWQHPGMSKSEEHLVKVVLPRAIAEIGSTNVATAHPLPSYVGGLYPFPVMPETLITDHLTGLVKKEASHMYSFWTLFDSIWAAESALIQCHVDSRRSDSGSHDRALNVEEGMPQSEEARKRLARTILAASDAQSDTPALQVFANIILSENADGHPPLHTRRFRDAWNQMAGFRTIMDESLGYFVRWLINRRVRLWDCNGELEAVSHEYQHHLTQWLQSSSPDTEKRAEDINWRGSAICIVDCPSMHPVPVGLLEEHMRKDGTRPEEVQPNQHVLSVYTSCPLCPENTKIRSARIIGPRDHLHNIIKTDSESDSAMSRQSALGSLSARTGSQSSAFSHSTHRSGEVSKPGSPTISAPKTKPNQSLDSVTRSASPRSVPWFDKYQSKHHHHHGRSLSRDLKNVKIPFPIRSSSFRMGGLFGESQRPQLPKYRFSSSGNTLLFWGENSNCVVGFDLPMSLGEKPRPYRYDVSGVQCVAGGGKCCAIIAMVGQHFELLVFGPNRHSAETNLTIETPHMPSAITMAMSRDGTRLALIINNQVHAYELDTNGRFIRKVAVAHDIDLSPDNPKWIPDDMTNRTAIHRVVEFSANAKHLIVASLFEDRSAHVDVWDCHSEQWRIAPNGTHCIQAAAASAAHDARLTSAFYHSPDKAIFLTGSANEYPILLSTSTGQTTSSPFSTATVHAAQSPSGNIYAVATQSNEIHIWNHNAGSLSASMPTRAKRATPKIPSSVFTKPGRLILSFPQEGILQIFWVKDERLMLRTTRLLENGEITSDCDLRGDLDRVMGERPSSANTSTSPTAQSPKSSPLSGPPVVDLSMHMSMMGTAMDDAKTSAEIMPPELPELGAN